MSWNADRWLQRLDKGLDLLERFVKVREREVKLTEDHQAAAKEAEDYDPLTDPDFDSGGFG